MKIDGPPNPNARDVCFGADGEIYYEPRGSHAPESGNKPVSTRRFDWSKIHYDPDDNLRLTHDTNPE